MIIGTPVAHHALLPIDFVKSLLAIPHKYTHIFQESCDIAENRNNLFEFARLNKDSLLMVDSDLSEPSTSI